MPNRPSLSVGEGLFRCAKGLLGKIFDVPKGTYQSIFANFLLIPELCTFTVACKETRRLGVSSTRKFKLLKSCLTPTLLSPNKGRLEVSKK